MTGIESEGTARLITRLPGFCVLVLIASLGFIQTSFPLFDQTVVVTDLVFLIAAGIWLISFILRSTEFRWHTFYWFILLYLAALLISSIFSTGRSVGLAKFPAEVYLAALCVLTYNTIASTGILKKALAAWLIGTSFSVIVGLLTILTFYALRENFLLEYLTYHYGAVPVGDFPRITATFVSASMFCNYLNVSLVIALLSYRQKWLRPAVGFTLISGILACSAFTVSIGIGGIFLAIGVWVWFTAANKKPAVIILTGVALAVAAAFLVCSIFALAPYPEATVWATIANVQLMPSSRFLVWRDAIRVFLSHPLTGQGLGTAVANVVFMNTDGTRSLLTDAHNSFLNVAAESGIIGSAAFVTMTGYLLRSWINAFSGKSSRPVTQALGLAFLCSFVYQGLTGSFEEARHLWVLMGIFLAADKIEKTP